MPKSAVFEWVTVIVYSKVFKIFSEREILPPPPSLPYYFQSRVIHHHVTFDSSEETQFCFLHFFSRSFFRFTKLSYLHEQSDATPILASFSLCLTLKRVCQKRRRYLPFSRSAAPEKFHRKNGIFPFLIRCSVKKICRLPHCAFVRSVFGQ
jgi:hypothetical protein